MFSPLAMKHVLLQVMTEDLDFVEVQASGEGATFQRKKGIRWMRSAKSR